MILYYIAVAKIALAARPDRILNSYECANKERNICILCTTYFLIWNHIKTAMGNIQIINYNKRGIE